MYGYQLIHACDNRGLISPQRSFPGYAKNTTAQAHSIAPREVKRIEMKTGDLVSIPQSSHGGSLHILAFDPHGGNALQGLGLQGTQALDMTQIDAQALAGWVSAKGGDETAAIPVAVLNDVSDQVVLKARMDLALWIARPIDRSTFVAGSACGPTTVTHQPANPSSVILPPELGEVREEFTIPRGTGIAYELKKGEYFQIIDVEGQQCSDFVAFRSDGLDRGEEWMIDGTASRSMSRRAFPTPGLFDKFFDQDARPLINVVQDTCGRHDTFGLACTARVYEERGFPGHVNCSDNISDALDPFGVRKRPAWPAINFFWNTWIDQNSHEYMTEESYSRAGDYVVMRAMDNLVCASTACPDEIDPVNGWNPTDIHVRIYRSDAPIRRAVAYREKEDSLMSISQESAFHERLAPLTNHFSPARDLWAPVSFPTTGMLGEYWACRNAVAVQDMSGLRKYDVVGPDAEKLLQLATTRNVAKLPVWRGSYTLMCDETGAVVDDGTLFRLGEHLFRWCCGTEESGRVLGALAAEHNFQVRVHALQNAMPNLAIQGPKSRDLLKKIVFTQPHLPALEQLKWFGATVARLNDRDGAPFMLTRSGYTGELGYEIFCAKADALTIWDAIMAAGEEFGVLPMGTAALATIRIEAGLAAAGAEFAPGVDAFEAGLGFAVDMTKAEFTGKAALERNVKDPRRATKGLLLNGDDVPAHGAPVWAGERQVGVVTSATRSPTLEHAIAIARISVEYADNGTQLEIGQLDGHMKRLGARVADIPFIDPQRKRARA
ncbi:DUF1989 domain-containing protein [Sulfitobacter sp. AS92]|uniref:DUF1989 domain-containing protein n=1 Tax=Sulfitobacter sp. AS92 TaxID=3135783 RepID=UPI00317E887D